MAAINLIKERGVENKQIKVVSRNFYIFFTVVLWPGMLIMYLQVSAVAAPPALQKLSENFPG